MAGLNATAETGLRSTVGQTLTRARSAIWGTFWFSMFINLLQLTGPLYMLQVYDRVLLSRSVETLVGISILMVIMYAFMGVLEWVRNRVLTRVANRFEADLGDRTFTAWLQQGLAGKSAERAQPMQDLSTLRRFLGSNGPGTFFDVPWVPIYIGVIFLLHPLLGGFAVAGSVVIVIAATYNEIATRKPMIEALKLRRAETEFNLQAHRNADIVTAMGMRGAVLNQWREINKRGALEATEAADRQGSASAFTKAFRMFLQSAILGLGGYLAVQQIITPGAMIAASIIMGRAMAPLQMAIGQWRGFTAARDAFGRLNAFYDGNAVRETETQLPIPTGRIAVEAVHAAPPGMKTAVLRNIDFNLPSGSGLGVVGPSASGKSTLAKLLVGVWLPQRGAVRLDGATFDQYDPDALGPHIGYLPQDVELFDGTIGANISRFRTDVSDEAIWRAAQMAGVHEMILRLPDGYDTRIGAGAKVLSGGQMQRIALARAVFGRPVLVVLDEPNASLDTQGDAALAACIGALRAQGTTVIVMAHRKSAIANLDLLLVLGDGQQTHFGPKADVIAALSGGPVSPVRAAAQEPRRRAAVMQGPMGVVTGGTP